MANISDEISLIQRASRGSEVRQTIVDALNKINSDVLPSAAVSDSGKILKVNSNGEWEKGSLDGYMPIPTASKNITENGTYDVTDYAQAVVNTPQPSGTIQITENGTVDVTDYESANVNVSGGSAVIEPLSVTENGTYSAPSGVDGYSPVVVNVSGSGGLPSGVSYGSADPDNSSGNDGDLYYQEFTLPASLVSDGNSYINTGYYPNAQSRVECCFKVHTLSTRYDTIFGCRNGSNGRFTARYGNSLSGLLDIQRSTAPNSSYSSGSFNFFTNICNLATNQTNLNKQQPLDLFIVVGMRGASGRYISFFDKLWNNSIATSANTDAFPYPIFLFANNNAGVAGDFAMISIRWCKIWNENNVLVRDLIPYDDNGSACMFDKVNNVVYANQGAGSFTIEAEKQHQLKAVWEKKNGVWVRSYTPDNTVFYDPDTAA